MKMSGPGFLKANPKIFWKALNAFYSAFKALTSNLYSLQEEELRNSKDFFLQKSIKSSIIFSSPCTSSTLQCKSISFKHLKCIYLTFIFMLILFLIFRNTWKIIVKRPNTKSEPNRSSLQITKTTLSDCISHETEVILNYCTIYKLTSISIQPLCPVCLLVMGKKRSRQLKAWSNMANPINSQSISMPCIWCDPAEKSKAFSHLPASYDLPSSGSKRT